MKYFKRANIYKNSTGTNTFYVEKQCATSYGWWEYVKRINGQLVFNNYTYSNSTTNHQSAMRSLLRDLGYHSYLIIEAPGGLQDLDSAIKYYESKIENLRAAMAKPRTRKAKNAERQSDINFYESKMSEVFALQKGA